MVNLIKIYHQLRHNRLTRHIDEDFLSSALKNSKGKVTRCPIELAFNYYIDTCNASNLEGEEQITHLRYVDGNMEVMHIYPLPTTSLYKINFTMHLPLHGHTLAWTLAAILQEKQVIFVSSNQNSNVLLMMTLVEMLLPFRWECMFVPNLPPHMVEAAEESFMPYMVGIHSRLLPMLSVHNRVVVQVDANVLFYNGLRVNWQGVVTNNSGEFELGKELILGHGFRYQPKEEE